MALVTRVADHARWDDLLELFGASGGTRGCWCMARRLPAATVAANGNAENRAALGEFLRAGEPVGVIGYVGDRPAAWCAVAPRPSYYAIVHSRTLPIDEPDDPSVWAINCLFVKRGYRGQGLTLPMIEAAVEYARTAGARLVEAYPVKTLPGDPGRGVLSTFLTAGFTPYAEHCTSAKRNIVVRRPL
ncbi:GNAT family N-acetyltransferase [Kribbella sp. NPDC004536]|uniref:GNAT family N-acetyltransferase n=1 Tax=Kribbella sp. NPDC004536 TaxID=3364106 RepID=UPI0036CAAA3C